ncbi:hypothetical protein BDZ90DRAFT_258365 [Jaminaea rosea]|uniref:RanBD1 domain-containing protein n=1 Tax=Jaminaea rosea TaxID=1569628 RepID=A0A316V1Z7_9BASI|nr:hypothetical protein BDZ90DRAFT_258365 [Jaminaea rosea]PWN29445.1 hypothetical protein BDZ90DRAFT_258365 [Jaminaea rosea]
MTSEEAEAQQSSKRGELAQDVAASQPAKDNETSVAKADEADAIQSVVDVDAADQDSINKPKPPRSPSKKVYRRVIPMEEAQISEEIASRKRDREGSLEPSSSFTSALQKSSQDNPSMPDAALPTKKNRLIESSSSGDSPTVVAKDDEAASDEGGAVATASVEGAQGDGGEKVGHIRRRVEELSYDERESKRADMGESHAAEGNGEAEKGTTKAAGKDSANAGDQPSKGDNAKSSEPPALPPRKDAAVAATSSSSTPAAAASATPVRKQPTFASFSSTSSPFTSTSARTGVSGPSWLAGSGASSSSPSQRSASPFGAPNGSAAASSSKLSGGMSGTTGAIKPSALGSSSSSSAKSPTSDTSSVGTATPKARTSAPSAKKAGGTPSLGFGAFAASKPFASAGATTSGTSSPATPAPGDEAAAGSSSAEGTPAASQSIFDQKQGTTADEADAAESSKKASDTTDVEATAGDDEAATGSAPKPKVQQLAETDLATGEEGERTIHSVRAKLYTMTKEGSKDGTWKERGTGTLRVNVPKDLYYQQRSQQYPQLGKYPRPSVSASGGSGGASAARLVMRAEGVLRLILNVRLFPGMGVELAQEKFVRFVALEGGESGGAPCHFAVRCSNGAAGRALYEAVKGQIPEAPAKKEVGEEDGTKKEMSKATGFVMKETEPEGDEAA